jgi:hypothetical protein
LFIAVVTAASMADLFVDFMAENRDISAKAAAWAAFLIFPLGHRRLNPPRPVEQPGLQCPEG